MMFIKWNFVLFSLVFFRKRCFEESAFRSGGLFGSMNIYEILLMPKLRLRLHEDGQVELMTRIEARQYCDSTRCTEAKSLHSVDIRNLQR